MPPLFKMPSRQTAPLDSCSLGRLHPNQPKPRPRRLFWTANRGQRRPPSWRPRTVTSAGDFPLYKNVKGSIVRSHLGCHNLRNDACRSPPWSRDRHPFPSHEIAIADPIQGVITFVPSHLAVPDRLFVPASCDSRHSLCDAATPSFLSYPVYVLRIFQPLRDSFLRIRRALPTRCDQRRSPDNSAFGPLRCSSAASASGI